MSSASSGDDGRKIPKDRGSSTVEEADKGGNCKMREGRGLSLVEDADTGGEISLKKGPWTQAEDVILKEYVEKHGEGNWTAVQKISGLARCGKSCRFRWLNHLRPNLKKGAFTKEEEKQIVELHAIMGNKWSQMAPKLPGRTDNEIKNFWNTRIKRMQRASQTIFPDKTEIYRQQVSNGDQENLNLDALPMMHPSKRFRGSDMIYNSFDPSAVQKFDQHNNNRSDNITKLRSSLSPYDLIGCDQFGNVLTDGHTALYGNTSSSSNPKYGALKVELPSDQYFEAQKRMRHTPKSSLPPLVKSVDTPESSIQFMPNQSATVSHHNNDGRQRILRTDESSVPMFQSVDTPEPNQSAPVSDLKNDGQKFEADKQ